jgi:hypothetical protein
VLGGAFGVLLLKKLAFTLLGSFLSDTHQFNFLFSQIIVNLSGGGIEARHHLRS